MVTKRSKSNDGATISTLILFSQNKGKESENSYQELKRSPNDRRTQTHGNCIEIFWQAWQSFSIGRDWKRWPCLSKYLYTVSMCLCVPVLRWSLQFLVRVFIFLSLNLWYINFLYFSYFTSKVFISFYFRQYDQQRCNSFEDFWEN